MKTSTAILIIVAFLSTKAQAIVFELNSAISSSSASTGNSSSTGLTANNIGFYANLTKAENAGFLLGWYITTLSGSVTYDSTVNQTLSSSDMGPVFKWVIDKKKLFSLSLAYNVLCKGSLTVAGTSVELSGTSQIIKFAVEPEISDSLYVGFGINSYSASYSVSTANNTQSNVSYTNSLLYPSLSLSYRF